MAPFRTADGRLLPHLPAPPPGSSSAEVARAAFRARLLGSLTTSGVLQWRFTKKHGYNTEKASSSGRGSPERRKRRMDSSSSSSSDDDEDGSDEDNGREVGTEITGGHYQIAVGSSIQEVPALAPVKKAHKDKFPPAATSSSDDLGEARGGPSPPPRSSRPWNLRKRRSVCGLPAAQRQHPQSPVDAPANNHLAAPRAKKDIGGTEKKAKTTLLLTPTKDEIYEDFILMTGAPPPRKHKKRPAKMQRYIQALYPEPSALCITADLYKVPEEKGHRR